MNHYASVSVVICTYRRPELLRKAIDGVLEQRYDGEIEIIVVFDQTDPDPEFVSEGPLRSVRVVRNARNPGLAGARNTGCDEATSEYLAFCDDDDIWLPDKLREQIAVLESTPAAIAAVCGIIVESGDHRKVRVPRADDLTTASLLRRRVMAAHPSTVLVRREQLMAIGAVDEGIPGSYAEDYDWMLRCAAHGRIAVVELPLVRVRWGATSYFADRWQTMADAIAYLIEKHPEFRSSPRGMARLLGRRAFALAAAGDGAAARRVALQATRYSWREPRIYLALSVSTRLISAAALMRYMNANGRGI